MSKLSPEFDTEAGSVTQVLNLNGTMAKDVEFAPERLIHEVCLQHMRIVPQKQMRGITS